MSLPIPKFTIITDDKGSRKLARVINYLPEENSIVAADGMNTFTVPLSPACDHIFNISLTQKEKEVFEYLMNQKRPPTIKEIQSKFSFKSSRSVTQYLETFVSKGLITRGKGARNINVLL